MDPIMELPAALPPHDAAPLHAVAHRVVAEWPAGTFLENLAVLPDGSVIVSVLSAARLDRVAPDGTVSLFRQFTAPPTGLALLGGALYVAVGEPGAGAPVLWRLDPANAMGAPWLTLAGMTFANGVTPFAPDALLIADSIAGALLRVDCAAAEFAVWFQDELLMPAPAVPFLPGANGIKRWGNEVTVTSNGRAEVHRIAVAPDGSAGGRVRIADRLRADDIAYDSAGRLYLTTHIGHSLDRLDRDGVRISLGGPDQALAGSTACAFGGDGALYVTTTGGIIAPVDGRVQPARLVRLEVDAAGHPLDRAWEALA